MFYQVKSYVVFAVVKDALEIITIDDSDSDQTMVVDLETYLAEHVCCIDVNGDISPAGPYEGYTSESPESHAGETLSYFVDLKKLATHLADISCFTLEQQRKGVFVEEDLAFANLVSDCRDELLRLGEYLMDIAKSIQNNINSQDVTELSSFI